MAKCLLRLRELAQLPRAGQRAALGWGPKYSPVSIIAREVPCPGAGVEGALMGPLTQQHRVETCLPHHLPA